MAFLLAKKISVPKEYTEFSDKFSEKSATMLFNHSNINKYTIYLKSDKQSPYISIYSLYLVEL